MQVMKKRWCIKEQDKKAQTFISRELNISPMASQLLINRGIRDLEIAHRFVVPSLSHIHSPLMMKDMGKALERIVRAISKNEKIIIYGDYDVDGITAVAIVMNFLKEIDADVSFYIPNRLCEGYGLNTEALRIIRSLGTELIITVDCGIADSQEISFAQREGMDVIVTDHHEVPDVPPPAYAILNPKQKECAFPFKSLAGVGVAFYLIIALRARLREMGFWGRKGAPNLREYLDLVALGTVADVVPLTDENRIFVKFGLKELTEGSRPGVVALKKVSGLEGAAITPGMVGFRLAPRINAAGRLSKPDYGVKLLTTRDSKEAERIVKVLDSENTERQAIEDRILREAKKTIETNEGLLRDRTIVLSHTGWHPGVIGIVASRLVEEYYKPTVLIALRKGIGRGSARSIEAFHLYEGLEHCTHLLERFGGHRHAAGLTIDEKNIPEFQRVFEEVVKDTLSEEDFIPKVHIDAQISLKQLTEEFLKELNMLSPFGVSNPEPTFCSSTLSVSDSGIVGNGHLKLKVKEDGLIYDSIGFRMGGHLPRPKQCIKAAFVPQINEWQGTRSIQLRLKDMRIVG